MRAIDGNIIKLSFDEIRRLSKNTNNLVDLDRLLELSKKHTEDVKFRKFDIAREGKIWIGRNESLKLADREFYGLHQLSEKLRDEVVDESLYIGWIEQPGFSIFIVANLAHQNLFGFMILKLPENLEARRAAFQADGSYDKY